MPRRVHAQPRWTDSFDVPIKGERVKAQDSALPDELLLGNTKANRDFMLALAARIERLERGQSGLSVLTPSAVMAEPGQTYSFPGGVAVQDSGGRAVNLSVLNVPAGVTVTLAPTTLTGPASADVTLEVGASVPGGVYNLTLRAEAGEVSREYDWPVTVTAQTLAPSFSVSSPQSALAIERTVAASATLPFAVNRQGGFNSPIALSVTGMPSGVSASFSPASMDGPAHSQQGTLTLTADPGAPAGIYSLQLRAAGGGQVRTLGFSLSLTAAATGGTPDYVLRIEYDAGATANGATIFVDRRNGFTGPVWVSGAGQLFPGTAIINGVTWAGDAIRVDGSSFRVIGGTTAQGHYPIRVNNSETLSRWHSWHDFIVYVWGGEPPRGAHPGNPDVSFIVSRSQHVRAYVHTP